MSTNPYQPPAPDRQEVAAPSQRIPESRYFLAWFVYVIAASVGGFCVGAVAGAIVGAVMAAQGHAVGNMQIVAGAIGFLLGLPVNYLCFRFIAGPLLLRG